MCTKVYALMLMLFAVVSVYGQDNVIDEVVWVVGDEAILKSDVENERLNAQYEGRKFDGDPYCIIPEQLAIQKLFLHQAAIDSIEVSEQEIISDVERRTNWLIDQIGSKEKVEEYYNKTSTQIREMLRENIRDGKTVQKMQQQKGGLTLSSMIFLFLIHTCTSPFPGSLPCSHYTGYYMYFPADL